MICLYFKQNPTKKSDYSNQHVYLRHRAVGRSENLGCHVKLIYFIHKFKMIGTITKNKVQCNFKKQANFNPPLLLSSLVLGGQQYQ